MIIFHQFPIKILTKKNGNLYIYNYEKPFKGETTKIILLKNKFLTRRDEDDEYWDFMIKQIIKLAEDWKKLTIFLKRDKFNGCKKVKIFSKSNKSNLKFELYKKNVCFVFSNPDYQGIDLAKLRENKKLYKKFENRYCYAMNYEQPDTQRYADYWQANLWFQWFSKQYSEYNLPIKERNRYDLTLGGCYVKDNLIEEPKMDYDYWNLFW